MRTFSITTLGVVLGALALTACGGLPVPPAYTQEELAARCVRSGGWWRPSQSYSLVSGHCEYKD